jgi:hypothetical protein
MNTLQIAPLPVTLDVEPRAEGSTLLYSLLAPKAIDQKARVMIAVVLRITNHGAHMPTFDKLRLIFAGPPFVAQILYQSDDVLGGEPDKVAIPPGTTRNLHFSRLVTILFTSPAPPGVTLEVTFKESTQTVTAFRHLARHQNPVPGGAYRLPFRAVDMPLRGFAGGSSGHRGGTQRFAYDCGVAQWDAGAGKWRGLKPGATENTNENQVDWGPSHLRDGRWRGRKLCQQRAG